MWSFQNPVAVRFGAGSIEAGASEHPWRRALIVTTAGMVRRGGVDKVRGAWKNTEFDVCDAVTSNPQLDELDALVSRWRGHDYEGIVALGGGSVLDAGKVLGRILETGSDFSLHRHFRENMALPAAKVLPVVAIPTTSGTGSEVTPFATVWDAPQKKKHSLTGPQMFPQAALLDPEMTHNLPWDVTVSTGLDALCQAMESIWNRHASPISMEFAMRGAALAWGALGHGEEVQTSLKLRSQLMEASLLAGLAISQTRTALCHSISYPVTGHFGVPHGVACAFVMPAVLRYNVPADDGRLSRLVRQLGFHEIEELACGLESLLRKLNIPDRLSRHGVNWERLRPLAPEMITPGRADNNLRSATTEDVEVILGNFLPRWLE